jgi:hypothetical protein
MVATVVLVGWPVIAGFWTTSPVEMAMSHPSAQNVQCLDLRVPENMDKVRHLPQPELQRYIVACNMTYTKECSAAGAIDPSTGRETYAEPPHCVIRDKHGKVVRTYTTDALRPTP